MNLKDKKKFVSRGNLRNTKGHDSWGWIEVYKKEDVQEAIQDLEKSLSVLQEQGYITPAVEASILQKIDEHFPETKDQT